MTDPQARPPARSRDAAAIGLLLVSALAAAWPILRGGYRTYLDNPVHLAEIHARAFASFHGWSDAAWCGFPVGELHSPLWYGALAWWARAGLPVDAAYAACLILGFVAPGLALYAVARRTTTPGRAGVLAWLLVLQPTAIVGIESSLGGMWTFSVAMAAVVMLAATLAGDSRGRRRAAAVALWTGLALSSHLFAIVPVLVVTAVHVWLRAARRAPGDARAGATADVLAVGLGAVAAAAYWMPWWLGRAALVLHPQNLTAGEVFARLVLPTDMLDLLAGRAAGATPAQWLQAVPAVVLALAGVAGVLVLSRRRGDVPVYGAVTAGIVLALVAVGGALGTRLLGPESWRLLAFVRAGMALSAIALVERVATARGRVRKRALRTPAPWAWAGVAGVAAAVWIGSPLRAVVPPPTGPALAQTRALWHWLAAHRDAGRGRVYLQDTFTGDRRDPLGNSHVLALTAREAGVRQLGAAYGAVPYATAAWTSSEFLTLFGRSLGRANALDDIRARARAAHVTCLVASFPGTADRLARAGGFERLTRVGRYTVFAVADSGAWMEPLAPGVEATAQRFAPGRIEGTVASPAGPGVVRVATAWHPFWRLDGAPGMRLEPGPLGLAVVSGIRGGPHAVRLEFDPPGWPRWVSVASWVLIALLGFVPRRRARAA